MLPRRGAGLPALPSVAVGGGIGAVLPSDKGIVGGGASLYHRRASFTLVINVRGTSPLWMGPLLGWSSWVL